jgi:glycosyltransferase involved in cell wall biosynthesis
MDDFIKAGCLADKSKAHIVNGSGVDLEHFKQVPLPELPVFLLIARLLKTKGIFEYVEAARRVKQSLPFATFKLAGPLDNGPDGISEEVLNSWIGTGIEYVGELVDVRPEIAAASVYVLPSYREGTPRTVLEAMSMGRPIITTDAPGCRETTIDGVNGFLVESRNINALADAMLKMGSSANLRSQMGEASRGLAVTKYDVLVVASKSIEILKL